MLRAAKRMNITEGREACRQAETDGAGAEDKDFHSAIDSSSIFQTALSVMPGDSQRRRPDCAGGCIFNMLIILWKTLCCLSTYSDRFVG